MSSVEGMTQRAENYRIQAGVLREKAANIKSSADVLESDSIPLFRAAAKKVSGSLSGNESEAGVAAANTIISYAKDIETLPAAARAEATEMERLADKKESDAASLMSQIASMSETI